MSDPVVSPSLEDDVVGTWALSNSVEWKLRDEVEWSVDVESKFFIKTLSLHLSFLVKIEYLPSLVGTVMSIPDNSLLTFEIFSLPHIKTFSCILDVAEVLSLENKDLPPS